MQMHELNSVCKGRMCQVGKNKSRDWLAIVAGNSTEAMLKDGNKIIWQMSRGISKKEPISMEFWGVATDRYLVNLYSYSEYRCMLYVPPKCSAITGDRGRYSQCRQRSTLSEKYAMPVHIIDASRIMLMSLSIYLERSETRDHIPLHLYCMGCMLIKIAASRHRDSIACLV